MIRIVHIAMNRSTDCRLSDLRRMVNFLAEAESRLGLQVSIWEIGSSRLGVDVDGVKHRSFGIQSNRFTLSPALRKALEMLRPDSIVHLHGGFVPEFFAISRFIRKSSLKLRLVLSPHGDYSEIRLRSLSPLRKAYYYLFERPVIREASLVHLLGPTEVNGYNFFIQQNTPFVCLPDGIANGLPCHANERQPGKDPFVVTYGGDINIVARGLDLLIDAFTKFYLEVATPVELWILGQGKDLDALRLLADRAGMEKRIKFFGRLSRKKREELFCRSSVYICPSRNGNCSDHALEAAALGVPMIVSEETNLGSFVRQHEAGWCLQRNTAEHLRQALHEAYVCYKSNPAAYAKLQHRSLTMVREEFNWNTLARKWKEVYSSVS
ncbi:MAG: glycosyltransferase family 4 protein [Bacteroidota bacterium]